MKRTRAALLVVAGFGAAQGAGACGRADSTRVDSETHWLLSCESDLDCAAGSCECGVCTLPCVSSAGCWLLGVDGVECVADPHACEKSGAESAADTSSTGSTCLLPCVDDADCSALGDGAVCESQRCEQPASPLADVMSGSTASASLLCDGSDDVRFHWASGLGNAYGYLNFGGDRNGRLLVIDGHCRFWRSDGAFQPVTTGILSAEGAAMFTSMIGYDRFAELAPFDDEQCLDAEVQKIWSPESRALCICRCQEDAEFDSWAPVFYTMFDPRVQALFADGQPLTGPLRMALMGYRDIDTTPMRRMDGPSSPWPLSRPPADGELYYGMAGDDPRLDASSGVDITDPNELSALRAAREALIELGDPGYGYVPLDWVDPDTQQQVYLRMLLRDELPAHVQAAVERPLF